MSPKHARDSGPGERQARDKETSSLPPSHQLQDAALRVYTPAVEPGAGSPDGRTPEYSMAERITLGEPSGGDVRHWVARSPVILDLIDKARQVARSKVPVLIQGESGTGKELLARLIHESSPRRGRPFIQVNCASFSEALVASELFGHEKGAFTGAEQRHLGYFERAAQGSVLLDEIGEMPFTLQARLLRVLEEETFDRVGGEQTLKVDVRLIATTNRDLEEETAQGRFRRDLFYRLNAMPLSMPALRARLEDLLPLVQYFIERYGEQGTVRVTAIAPQAMHILRGYSWPGNIRQLRNVIHHACVLARGECIEPGDLPVLREPGAAACPAGSHQSLADIERQLILTTLRDVGGNKTAAALRLGVTVRTLQNKLKRYRETAA
jgi:two-component system response regulator HydG